MSSSVGFPIYLTTQSMVERKDQIFCAYETFIGQSLRQDTA